MQTYVDYPPVKAHMAGRHSNEFSICQPNHTPAYIAAILIVMVPFNLFGVRYFGESEFYFSLIKSGVFMCTSVRIFLTICDFSVTLIIVLIISGLVITLGGGPDRTRRGFQYWNNPGAVARAGLVDGVGTDRFLAILSVIVQAAFSFQGMELIAMYVL